MKKILTVLICIFSINVQAYTPSYSPSASTNPSDDDLNEFIYSVAKTGYKVTNVRGDSFKMFEAEYVLTNTDTNIRYLARYLGLQIHIEKDTVNSIALLGNPLDRIMRQAQFRIDGQYNNAANVICHHADVQNVKLPPLLIWSGSYDPDNGIVYFCRKGKGVRGVVSWSRTN